MLSPSRRAWPRRSTDSSSRTRRGRLRRFLAVCTAATGIGRALAVPIPGVVSTGLGSGGVSLPGGALDPHWQLAASADRTSPGPRAFVVRDGYPIPPWLDNSPASKWIAPQAAASPGNVPGDYVYRLTFDLTGLDPATAELRGRWSSDNAGTGVRLNGRLTGIAFDGNFAAFSPEFILREGFVPGTNTLEFTVNNAGTGVNPTGFRAEVSGSAEALPPAGTPPSLKQEPADAVVAPKETATFQAVAAGSPPFRFEWRLDGAALAGATNASLVVETATVSWVGGYQVVVRNDAGAVTSRVARLTLRAASPAERSYEPPGPSSRRTGIVLSEIQHRPVPGPDGRSLPFVELYNSNPFFEDLSGWRLSGDFDFTFPTNTLLEGQRFLVVAPSPDAFRAAGVTNVLGGFALPSAGRGFVRLRKRSGAVVLEVRYDDSGAWPAAAFGAGHSLVLARPSLGEGDPRAWAASFLIGGSPGGPDPVPSGPLENVVLNEFLAHPGPEQHEFVEVRNHSLVPVDVSGCIVREDTTGVGFRLPPGTTLGPGGLAAFSDPALDLPAGGGRLLLFRPDGRRVLDALRYGGQARGNPSGRSPDGDPAWRILATATPGQENGPAAEPPVVFHEILYHPIAGQDGAEFVELFNPSGHSLALGGWRLTGGVAFEFPPDATIPGRGFAVVTGDADAFRARHPGLDPACLFGNWAGALSDRGERIVLARPEVEVQPTPFGPVNRRFLVAVDEVAYAEGGRWGPWADGGGSSLELVDPRADRRLGPNWADSDETRGAPWTPIEVTGTLSLAHPAISRADELQVMLLGAGEVLLDDVEVLVSGANRVANGAFDGGTGGWSFQGTHRLSRWAPAEGFGGGGALRLVASGRGDHVVNRARTVLASSIPSGTTATIRARARWLHGHPEILLRLRNGALEAVGRLELPAFAGTPGAPNSRALANGPPAITDVQHRPILPAAFQPVTVTARVADPDGIDRVILRYRLDPSREETGLPMTDDGEGPDEFARDGVFTARIPAQRAGALIAFRVVAQDASTAGGLSGALAAFPSLSLDGACLVRFGESQVPGAFGTYRVWLTQADHDRWAAREKMSNEDVPATFVYGAHRVIHGAGAHYSGSSYTSPGYTSPTGALCGYDLAFPPDDPFLGDSQLTLDWPIRDNTDQREQLMFWFLEQLGLPNMYRRYVHLVVNGARRGTIYDDVQQPGRDTVDEWFPDDDQGSLWKTDCWNEFDAGGSRIDPCVLNTLQRFPSTGPLKTARYRWNWRPRAVRGSASDFTDLFALVEAVNRTRDYEAGVEALVDVDHWMRTFAMNDLASFWDAFGNPNAKNTFLYKPTQAPWKLLSWDFDVGLGVFNDPPNAPLFDVNDPTLARMYRTPAFVRRYWAALEESLNGFFRTGAGSALDALLDAKYRAFQAAGVSLAGPAAIKSWIVQRRSFLLTQVGTVRAPFAIRTGGGLDFSTNRETISIGGTAPVAVRWMTVNGSPSTVNWTSVTNWSVNVILRAGENVLDIRGLDRAGVPVPGAADRVTIRFTGTPSPTPAIRFNEWMASNRSALRDPADGDFEDWFELVNLGDVAVDLAGFSLTDNPAVPRRFVVPPGFVIDPGGFLVVWADGEPEQTRFGTALHAGFRLDRDGSDLALFDTLGRPVDVLRFGPQEVDVSEGRWGDGAPGPFFGFERPTPGGANATPLPGARDLGLAAAHDAGSGEVVLSWDTIAGRRYRVEFRPEAPGDEPWQELSGAIPGAGVRAVFRDRLPPGTGRRFYRVRWLP